MSLKTELYQDRGHSSFVDPFQLSFVGAAGVGMLGYAIKNKDKAMAITGVLAVSYSVFSFYNNNIANTLRECDSNNFFEYDHYPRYECYLKNQKEFLPWVRNIVKSTFSMSYAWGSQCLGRRDWSDCTYRLFDQR